MLKSLVLLDNLLPTTAIELGRLVLDIRLPDQDFFQSKETTITDDDITIQRLEEFSYSLQRAETSGVHVLLSTLLSGSRGSENGSNIDLSSSICITRQLQNSDQFFENICASRATRAWLERTIRKRKDVYLITGIKTVADAQVGATRKRGMSWEGKVQAPTSLAATAAGVPLPEGILDVGAGGSRSAEVSEKTSFVAPGEYVFAVQYRKVRVSWLSSRDVDHAYLQPGNRWKVYLGGKGEDDDVENIINIEVGDCVQEGGLKACESFTFNGEEYLCIK